MTTPLPTPETGYAVDSTMDMTPGLFNSIFGSIHARLVERENLEADFEDLIAAGTSAALELIQVNIAPQLGELQETIDAALEEITIISEGVAPNSVLLNSQPASYYLNPANFSVSANIKTFLAAANYAAARAALSVPSTSDMDTAIGAAVTALVGGAPSDLNTMGELAAAIGEDAEFSTTVALALASKADDATTTAALAGKVAKAGEGLTGGFRSVRHDYGTLTGGTITLNLANGNGGKVFLGAGGGTIAAPAAPTDEVATMVIDIIGNSDATGTPVLSGFDDVAGDALPDANQKAVLTILRTSEACFATIKRKP